MSGFDESNRFYFARFISAAISLLSPIMAVFCAINHNNGMVAVSFIYGLMMFASFLALQLKRNMYFFYASAITLIFGLELVFLLTGGTEGFGLIWLTIIPLFSLYILEKKSYILVNCIMTILLTCGMWTPLFNYCYPFTDAFRYRFPLVIIIEIIFGCFLKNRIELTESQRIKLVNELKEFQETLQQQVDDRTKELTMERNSREKLMIELLTSLAATIDAKDKYTSGHSQRVAKYSKMIASRMNYTEKQLEDLYLIALLHDIGKIAIPDGIINKTSKLTDEEFAIIKHHPIRGNEILSSIKSMPEISYGARWHHERWDGKGYPDGLIGNGIPEIAQIISVADSYDAMTSTRSYRNVLPQHVVRNEIIKGKNTQFNGDIADIMIKLIDEDKEYIMHE